MSASSDGPRRPNSFRLSYRSPWTTFWCPAWWWSWTPARPRDLGAFEETALTEAEAWEANADLDADEVRDGE